MVLAAILSPGIGHASIRFAVPFALRRVRVLCNPRQASHPVLLDDPVLTGSPCVWGLLESLGSDLICNFRVTFLIYDPQTVEADALQEELRVDNQFGVLGTEEIAGIGDTLEVEKVTLRVSFNSEAIACTWV